MAQMYSPLWHRVEALRPRLKPQVVIERHIVRGHIWYVAQDRLSSKSHRMTPAAYGVLMRLDGNRTVADVWQAAVEAGGEAAPSQDQMIQLLGQLYGMELLQSDTAVDTRELSERKERIQRRQFWQRTQNPLFLKLSLLDPDKFLDRTSHLVRPLVGMGGLVSFLIIIGWLAAQAAIHWDGLTSGILDRALARENLILIVVIFPLLKLIHELGHAYATKIYGGEVHDVGLMLLVLVPIPYVDASHAAAFPGKWPRVLVSAAGMMAELVVAALAMAVWIAVEPGLVRALAFNTLLIAGVSTVVFNANPLLRFDGYFILSDLVEVPNLAQRANAWWTWLVQRHGFGMRQATPPETHGELGWLIAYAPLAFGYRLAVLGSIAILVGTQYFFVGVALAIWTLVISLVWPLLKAMRFVLLSPALGGRRLRAVSVTSAIIGAVVLALFAMPVPHGTVVRGVVWTPDEARIVAEVQGRFVRFLATPGMAVRRGDPLVQLEDQVLKSQARRALARLAELEHRLMLAETTTPFDIEVIQRQIELLRSEVQEAERKAANLTIVARIDGVMEVSRAADMEGTDVKRGHLFGFVLPEGPRTVRAVVPEGEIDTVRTLTRQVAVRVDGTPWSVTRDANVTRTRPAASRQLPSTALGEPTGGPFPIDPSSKDGDLSLISFFEVDVELPSSSRAYVGERAWVRFDHGAPPIAERLWRNLRQLLLRHFNV